MPAHTYLQEAAAQIRRAILEKRHEVDTKKREIGDKEQAMHRELQEQKDEQRRKESAAGDSDTNDAERIALLAQAQRDVGRQTEIQNNFNQERERLQREISDLERDIMDLENKARELETRT